MKPKPSHFPEHVTFYDLMGIEAARRASGTGGGWRLYVFAKALDKTGLGSVVRDDLRAFILSLGVNPRTCERWIAEARNAGLVTDWQKQSGEWMLALVSAGRAGYALQCVNGIGRKVEMAARDLVRPGWRARVFSAWESGKQISREQIQKAVNVSVSTQRYRDSQAGTKRQRNYSKSAITADNLTGIQENTNHKGTFATRDGFVAWRLPDTRTTAQAVKLGRGRARKANKIIRQLATVQLQSGLSKMRQAFSAEVEKPNDFIRLFNSTPDERKATERKLSRTDSPIREIYERAREAKSGSVIWKHCPLR